MNYKPLYIIPLLLLFAAINVPSLTKKKTVINPNSFFPVNNGLTLVYKSSFGESITKYSQNDEFTISSSEADNFKYRQTMIIKEDGVYVKETYQYLKIFLFIKKEATFTYGKPLLRFPLPLFPGAEWQWEGDEYCDGETNKVKVTGKAFNMEYITTKAGRFEAIKLESVVEGSGNSKNRVTEWFAEGTGLIKAKIVIEGGGVMGILRDILGYGTIEFELIEIRKE
ncbi:MAG: hypothetical protein CVV24_11975 [Ignavibacteriae bacterium HGW-Ignavibacteriae-3]|nr:MAG: hypothetical protein CVV24_11975 [Ignavibacteriae bacterium HGW-Ignavibacteriae-3]